MTVDFGGATSTLTNTTPWMNGAWVLAGAVLAIVASVIVEDVLEVGQVPNEAYGAVPIVAAEAVDAGKTRYVQAGGAAYSGAQLAGRADIDESTVRSSLGDL